MDKISVDVAKKIKLLEDIAPAKAAKHANELAVRRWIEQSNQKLVEYYGKEISEVDFQNKIVEFFKNKSGIHGLEAGCGCGKTIIAGKICVHRLKHGKTIVINPNPLSIKNSIQRDIDRCIKKYGKGKKYDLSDINVPSLATVYFWRTILIYNTLLGELIRRFI